MSSRMGASSEATTPPRRQRHPILWPPVHMRKRQCYPPMDVRPSLIPGAGRGAFATRPLRVGRCLGPYWGELIDGYEYVRRYHNTPAIYALEYDEKYVIDSSTDAVGNWTRYMNDARGSGTTSSLENNCVFIRGYVYTTRDVRANDELLVDYGPAYWRELSAFHRRKNPPQRTGQSTRKRRRISKQ